ncbi:MAG: hypothetical protein II743_06965 [Lachnospiraceae bacterium]|nr:hypothetical protein [Lachnospiraceae bacterium]
MAEESKVCPKCGMQLVGRNNYCMGCGVNVDLSPDGLGSGRENNRGFGNRYLNPEYIAREKAARAKRRQKKNIFDERGLNAILSLALGLLLGVGIGAYLLSLYFAPKDVTVTYQKKELVTTLAGVDWIDPPKDPFEEAFWEAQEKGKDDKKSKSSEKKQEEKVEKEPTVHYFFGEFQIDAHGDRVKSFMEQEVWETKDANPNSVTNVVNHLEQQGAPFQFSVFVDFEVLQEDGVVTLKKGCHSLDLQQNLVSAITLGLIEKDCVVTVRGQTYLSLRKLKTALEAEDWELKAVPVEESPSPEDSN